MHSKRLTIRADATQLTGIGHVMRCLALAQAWKKQGGQVHFVGCIEPVSLQKRLVKEKFEYTYLPAIHPSPADLTTLLAVSAPNEWVVLDGYHFDTAYQQSAFESGRKTLVLDDVNDRGTYIATMLLNQNNDGLQYKYDINEDAQIIAGTDYTMLREEFLQQKKSPLQFKNRILITLGGSDPDNITGKILESLVKSDNLELEITVVAGPANIHMADLQKRVNSLKGRAKLYQSADNMPQLMSDADIAITAAGSTCWELCHMGVPMLLIKTADNQAGIEKTLAAKGAGVVLDKDEVAREIAPALQTLLDNPSRLQSMSMMAKKLVDGHGAAKVVQSMLSIKD